jgi:hypothetical protein
MPEISEAELAEFRKAAEAVKGYENSKTRLEDENSKIKLRAKEAEEKLLDAEVKRLEADGKVNDLLALERVKSGALSEKLASRTKAVLSEKVKSEVSKYAKDAHDIDMLLKVAEHKALLTVDEESLSVSGAEDFVSKVRDTHGFLFNAKKMPDYNNKKTEDKEEDNKSSDEKYREELQGVTDRKQLAAVQKKYGKHVDSYNANY